MLQATIDPDKYETTLTVTGAGGFGKTTTVISLCHHPIIRESFTDGFIYIELGPQATAPSIKLNQLYHLLTEEYLEEHCDINHAEQEIKELTCNCYHNLLIIIDDVWHVEDAEPLVKAFSNCKTILTTRMNNIEQYIPSKQSVIIGPMTQHEAITLLTSGVIDSSQLSQEDVSLLDELAQDVHLWPLLLSLIRGQLSHNLKQCHLSYHKAIENVRAKLHQQGVTAFDQNNIASVTNHKLAVHVCMETTLELLSKSVSNRIKTLILYTGIGTSIQTAVLNNLWNISKQEAKHTVDVLWSYGLVQFIDVAMSPDNITQHCVEVHAVIGQYIIENMHSDDAFNLSPIIKLNTAQLVRDRLRSIFLQSHGIHDPSSLTVVDYLKYKLTEIDNDTIPFYLKAINMRTVSEPHFAILMLEELKCHLLNSSCTISLSLGEEIDSLIDESKQVLRDAHKLCRKINQSAQRILYGRNYDRLVQSVEDFVKNYPLCNVAQKAVTLLKKKVIPYCDGELQHGMMLGCEHLEMLTTDYHHVTTFTLPYIRLCVKQHKQINGSLLNGSPDVGVTYQYFKSGKSNEDFKLLNTEYLFKIQEIAPNYVHRKSLQLQQWQ